VKFTDACAAPDTVGGPTAENPPQDSLLESWLRERQKPVLPRKRQIPSGQQKAQNPKWTDDAWFKEEYGDPDYYTRVKGL
jgi:hypothetical protein